MPRVARVVVEKIPHHITQRGNRGGKVFFEEKDYLQYLEWLSEYSGKSGLAIYAYCLMPNHVHIIGEPRDKQALAAVMRPLHMRYAQWINRQRRWSGHLWQGRFFTEPNPRMGKEVIVNREFVHRYLSDREPLGQVVNVGGADRTIVGIVENIKPWKLQNEQRIPYVYVPISQYGGHAMTLFLHTEGDPVQWANAALCLLRPAR